jgi:hypothetical protein
VYCHNAGCRQLSLQLINRNNKEDSMTRRLLSVSALALLLALPVSASQFVQLPFDAVARNAAVIVRGTLGPVTGAWDDSREVIYSTATLSITHYFGGTGPRTLMVREVGGTVGDYTQEAIGFPALREGQEVILFLTPWEDSADWRIEAYNQGKFRVFRTLRGEFVSPDDETQGAERAGDAHGRVRAKAVEVDDAGISLDEFAGMVSAARGARRELPVERRK